MQFNLKSKFQPTGDQPQAIETIFQNIQKGVKHQTLWGVTGSGKTFTMANVINKIQKPTLVVAHNKTLAAQLADEFREFFPDNAVHYFVSYYDYYQPEAYIPHTDTYIEKDSSINDEIDRLRHAATHSLMTRSDVIIVASVSCIYGIGSPEFYKAETFSFTVGSKINRKEFLYKLNTLQFERNDYELKRGSYRLKGDTLELMPAYANNSLKIQFFGDEVEKISEIDWISGKKIKDLKEIEIFPAKHFITPFDIQKRAIKDIQSDLKIRLEEFKNQSKPLEAERLGQRTNFDIEMIEQTGSCSGIENYSRYFDQRSPGQPPTTLIDYFPKDFFLFIDESHMTVPQVRGMYAGDLSRKEKLVDYGFRLPSAKDNRPLKFPEFYNKIDQVVFVSATPSEYELTKSTTDNQIGKNPSYYDATVRQFIRPTGLLDPVIEIRKTKGQIADLIKEVKNKVNLKERVLVTTLTKRMAEELTDFMQSKGICVAYIHSDIDTLERLKILRDLRLGKYDVLVGINLLREGLDLPEVSLIVILDADKEGFLRSKSALIQTMGRAARHINGRVIMYADTTTGSMREAIKETRGRRKIQEQYNIEHNITPRGISKELPKEEERIEIKISEIDRIFKKLPKQEKKKAINDLKEEMKKAAGELAFERAADLRDQILMMEGRL